MSREERRNRNNTQSSAKRAKGFDVVQIVQTGHICYVDVKDVGEKSAQVVIGVRSAVGNRYSNDHDDHNEVTIFWSRYFKDADMADKFADTCEEGKYVTVFGNRQDYNVKNDKGIFEKKCEFYNIDTIQWGVDYKTK